LNKGNGQGVNNALGPFYLVAVDAIGPLEEDFYHNKHIFVFIDCFSRFVELVPMPDTTALSALHAFASIYGRYGVPIAIRMDNGSSFANQIITQMLEVYKVIIQPSIPHHHEGNSIVERANREVGRHLRGILFDLCIKPVWSTALPFVQRIMNQVKNRVTGVRPIDIIFGLHVTEDKHRWLRLAVTTRDARRYQ
jgi:transposase InsO family protein